MSEFETRDVELRIGNDGKVPSYKIDIPEGGTKGTAPYTLGILCSEKLRELGWKLILKHWQRKRMNWRHC